jgi:isopenicillin-N epimerase
MTDTDWAAVREQFDLSPELVHLGASQYLASHPRPVREAIDRHRGRPDADPVGYVEENELAMVTAAQEAAADYTGGRPDDLAVTESTTMGLALIYHGLAVRPGDEILTHEHDYFPHHEAIRLACERTGADVGGWALVGRLRKREALSLAYFDVFWAFAVAAVGLSLLVLIMRPARAEAGAHVAAE